MPTTRTIAMMLAAALATGAVAACDEETAQETGNAQRAADETASAADEVSGDAALSSQVPGQAEDISEGDGAGTAPNIDGVETSENAGSTKPDAAVLPNDMSDAERSQRVWEEEKDPVWTEKKGSIDH